MLLLLVIPSPSSLYHPSSGQRRGGGGGSIWSGRWLQALCCADEVTGSCCRNHPTTTTPAFQIRSSTRPRPAASTTGAPAHGHFLVASGVPSQPREVPLQRGTALWCCRRRSAPAARLSDGGLTRALGKLTTYASRVETCAPARARPPARRCRRVPAEREQRDGAASSLVAHQGRDARASRHRQGVCRGGDARLATN